MAKICNICHGEIKDSESKVGNGNGWAHLKCLTPKIVKVAKNATATIPRKPSGS